MSGPANKPVIILGAGLTGLAAAERLASQGRRVHVLEGQPVAGGLCRPLDLVGRRWDRYYHHVLRAETEVQDLIREVGLGGDLVWRRVRQGIVKNGRVLSFDRGLDPIRLGGGPGDWARDLAFGLRAFRLKNILALDRETALAWVGRHQSRSRVEDFWRPLLQKKFGDHADRISAWWLADRITCRASSKQWLWPGESLGHLQDGFARLAERLEERCREKNVEISLGISIKAFRVTDQNVRQIETSEGALSVDGSVLSTLPFPVLAGIFPQESGIDVALLARPVYMGCLCVALVLDRPLSPFYWLSNLDPAPFAALIEQAHLSQDDGHLIYLPRYLPQDETPDDGIKDAAVDQALEWLSTLLPGFEKNSVRAQAVMFDPYCQPVFFAGHVKQRPDRVALGANLIATDAFLDFPNQTRSMSAAIRRAYEAVSLLS